MLKIDLISVSDYDIEMGLVRRNRFSGCFRLLTIEKHLNLREIEVNNFQVLALVA